MMTATSNSFVLYKPNSDESKPSWLKPELKLKDFQLGSARDLFPFSSKLKIDQKRAEIDWLILIFFILIYVAKS